MGVTKVNEFSQFSLSLLYTCMHTCIYNAYIHICIIYTCTCVYLKLHRCIILECLTTGSNNFSCIFQNLT